MKIQSTEFVNGLVAVRSREIVIRKGVGEVPDKLVPELLVNGAYTVAPRNPKHWTEAKNILVIRGEGIGDVLMCTPIIREVRKIVGKKVRIDFLTKRALAPVMFNNPDIDNVYDNKKIPLERLADYNYHICVNNMEFRRKGMSKGRHRVDVFGEAAKGLSLPIQDKRLVYNPTKDELEIATDRVTAFSKGKRIVCVAITASCQNRCIRRKRLEEITGNLVGKGYRVILLDARKNNGWGGNGILNLCGETNIREAAAIIACSDLILTPDTGVLHIAAALDKIAVAYFGAINWEYRKTHDKLCVLYHNVECYPCNGYNCQTAECVRKLSNATIINTIHKILG